MDADADTDVLAVVIEVVEPCRRRTGVIRVPLFPKWQMRYVVYLIYSSYIDTSVLILLQAEFPPLGATPSIAQVAHRMVAMSIGTQYVLEFPSIQRCNV